MLLVFDMAFFVFTYQHVYHPACCFSNISAEPTRSSCEAVFVMKQSTVQWVPGWSLGAESRLVLLYLMKSTKCFQVSFEPALQFGKSTVSRSQHLEDVVLKRIRVFQQLHVLSAKKWFFDVLAYYENLLKILFDKFIFSVWHCFFIFSCIC